MVVRPVVVSVIVRMTVIVVVVMVRLPVTVIVIRRMRVRVSMRGRGFRSLVLRDDLDMGTRNTGPNHARRDEIVIETEAAERGPHHIDRHTGIDERAEHHVAGRAGKAVEVDHPRHIPSRASLNEQYVISARIR